MPYIIYADIESLITKTGACTNNPETFSTTKFGGHIPFGHLMSRFQHLITEKTNILYVVQKIV